jgi:hypothetical protein
MKQSLSRLLTIVATALLVACGYPGPPKPPSLNLPEPPRDLRAIRKGNDVHLAWTVPAETTDGLGIRSYGATRVCRSTDPAMSDCTAAIGQVAPATVPSGTAPAPKLQQNFTDTLPGTLLRNRPSAEIFYAVSVLNSRHRSAGISNIVSAPAVTTPSPPTDFRAEVTAAGIMLHWIPLSHVAETPDTHRVYRVYRREANGTLDTIVGEAPLDSSQLTDHSFDWEKTYLYRATVVTLIHPPAEPEREFESDDTPSVRVFAHDTFPPAVPTGLQAAFSGVGQQPFIDLVWTPDSEADLAGYNIYRHEDGGGLRKLNSQPVKTPSFRDADVLSGHTYIYSVSAIDIRRNESALSGEASETVP